jgi:hypothetical protein
MPKKDAFGAEKIQVAPVDHNYQLRRRTTFSKGHMSVAVSGINLFSPAQPISA